MQDESTWWCIGAAILKDDIHTCIDSPRAWRPQILNICLENLKVFYTLPETNNKNT